MNSHLLDIDDQVSNEFYNIGCKSLRTENLQVENLTVDNLNATNITATGSTNVNTITSTGQANFNSLRLNSKLPYRVTMGFDYPNVVGGVAIDNGNANLVFFYGGTTNENTLVSLTITYNMYGNTSTTFYISNNTNFAFPYSPLVLLANQTTSTQQNVFTTVTIPFNTLPANNSLIGVYATAVGAQVTRLYSVSLNYTS